jgi:hypothetical protein
MDNLLRFINENPWLNVVFILLTLASIILSMIFYFRSRRFKKPYYAVHNYNLVRESVQRIETVTILYQDKRIENLSVAKVAIWNSGKETINKSDIAQNDKLRIEINGDHSILESEIIFVKNPANGFKIIKTENPNIIEVDFDYFDYNEGVIINLYHTASENNQIEVKGSIKTIKSIKRSDASVSLLPSYLLVPVFAPGKSWKRLRKIFGWFCILLPSVLLILALVIPENPKPTSIKDPPMIITIIIVTALYWYLGLRILIRKIPKGFDVFNERF